MILDSINNLIEESQPHKLGLCLHLSLKAIKNNKELRLFQGPPGRPEDTSHFWTVKKNGKIYDPAKLKDPKVVPDNYKYIGREVNPDNILKELKIKWKDI